MKKISFLFCFLFIFHGTAWSYNDVDVFVLGDSQITFSAHGPYKKFFGNLGKSCQQELSPNQAAYFTAGSAGILGIESTGFQTWVSKSGYAWGRACTWRKEIIGGSRGFIGSGIKWMHPLSPRHSYAHFCRQGVSPLSIMLNELHDPKLFVMNHLGNSVWAVLDQKTEKPNGKALGIFNKIGNEIPESQPCLLMTSTPTRTRSRNKRRMKAQKVIYDAYLKSSATHCSFVLGFDEWLVSQFEANPARYGHDAYHPSKAGVNLYLDYHQTRICEAVKEQLEKIGIH